VISTDRRFGFIQEPQQHVPFLMGKIGMDVGAAFDFACPVIAGYASGGGRGNGS
jgi:hypothetical protein